MMRISHFESSDPEASGTARRGERGASLAQYGLLAALIFAVVVGAVFAFGGNVEETLEDAEGSISTGIAAAPSDPLVSSLEITDAFGIPFSEDGADVQWETVSLNAADVQAARDFIDDCLVLSGHYVTAVGEENGGTPSLSYSVATGSSYGASFDHLTGGTATGTAAILATTLQFDCRDGS